MYINFGEPPPAFPLASEDRNFCINMHKNYDRTPTDHFLGGEAGARGQRRVAKYDAALNRHLELFNGSTAQGGESRSVCRRPLTRTSTFWV